MLLQPGFSLAPEIRACLVFVLEAEGGAMIPDQLFSHGPYAVLGALALWVAPNQLKSLRQIPRAAISTIALIECVRRHLHIAVEG
jgi:hypothetical protein